MGLAANHTVGEMFAPHIALKCAANEHAMRCVRKCGNVVYIWKENMYIIRTIIMRQTTRWHVRAAAQARGTTQTNKKRICTSNIIPQAVHVVHTHTSSTRYGHNKYDIKNMEII